jgi:membrane-bound lytic murein transglycosylase D
MRFRLLATTVGFCALLVSGVASVAAEDFDRDSRTPERDSTTMDPFAAPPRDEVRLEVSVEPLVADRGSAGAPASTRPDPEPWGASDPWADAIAGVIAPTVRTHLSPYPVVMNDQVRYFVDRFTGERREAVDLWLSRAGRYLGMIRDILRRNGLPEDLAFTAMIESGFNPLAVSHAGAKGLWQFMAATARRYGLRVDQWVDERLDPEKATGAAAAYLRDLHGMFGSWTLAQAAYNAGEMRVIRALRVTGENDFWPLMRTQHLARETKDFVPQIQAAVVIGRDPGRYGFSVKDLDPIQVERVAVPPSTDLTRLAAAAGMPSQTLRGLNPGLVKGITPPGAPYEVQIPAERRHDVLSALAPTRRTALTQISGAARAAGGPRIHVVRPRETISSIAKRYGLSTGDVLRLNTLERQDAIRPGDRIRVGDRMSLAR